MKERLTGAIILVALIVLLVPELLTGPIRRKAAPAAAAFGARAAQAQAPLRTYSLTLTAGAPAREARTSPAPPAERSAQSPTESAQESPPAGPASAHAPASRTAPAPRLSKRRAPAGAGLPVAQSPAHSRATGASAASRGWVVQLGSFASQRNADHLALLLKRKGFRLSVSPARAGARVLWRVRAGPAHDRASAEHLAARLRALGYRGELLPLS